MIARGYDDELLFMGILSVRGFPSLLQERLEASFGPVDIITEPFPFTFTDYYVPEMGEGIERFFISFSNLVQPDTLAMIKERTNEIEGELAEDGKRSINLDPGLLSLSSIVLATTKNRSHRIAIGRSLYAAMLIIGRKRCRRYCCASAIDTSSFPGWQKRGARAYKGYDHTLCPCRVAAIILFP